jgi:hypothetical protein
MNVPSYRQRLLLPDRAGRRTPFDWGRTPELVYLCRRARRDGNGFHAARNRGRTSETGDPGGVSPRRHGPAAIRV